ncbi:replicative DNA helicase [bacterium]|nr:MAG: replicative DNA helicase [bacterium]
MTPTLPHNTEVEEYVLSCALVDEEAIYRITPILESSDFYDDRLKEIYECYLELFNDRRRIDLVNLADILKKRDRLKFIGGKKKLIELASLLPTASQVEDYSKIVKESSIRRKLISKSSDIATLSRDETKSLSDVVNTAQQDIMSISEQSIKSDFAKVSDLLLQYYEKIEELHKHKGEYPGIRTHFATLDKMLGGFQGSDLIILGARPSVGKTSLALDFVRHMGIKENKKVAFFSLEMAAEQLIQRMVSAESGVAVFNLRTNKISEVALHKITQAEEKLAETDIFIDETPGINISEMRVKARKLKMNEGLDIIVVDYLQLIAGNRKENRVQEVSEISRELKNLARELQVPVVALSQLSRSVVQRGADSKPQLSDLRESGSIEQDADIVMFLHRPMFTRGENQDGATDDATLIIAKHRNGPTGEIELQFMKEEASYREKK